MLLFSFLDDRLFCDNGDLLIIGAPPQGTDICKRKKYKNKTAKWVAFILITTLHFVCREKKDEKSYSIIMVLHFNGADN